jgi:hypothetical protein
MNGLIKPSKLGDVGGFGILAIAFASVSAVLYVLATAFTGGGLA